MKAPWTASEHISMHWRPDAVIKTSVIQPMWVRQLNPVDMARHTIDPFIAAVRGPGPAVNPTPSPEDVAYAAGKLAQHFRQGKSAVVAVGPDKVKVSPNTQCGGIVGLLAQAARALAQGNTVSVEFGGRRVIVCNNGQGGAPVVQSAAPTAPAVSTTAAPAAAPPSNSTDVAVRPTPMPMTDKSGLGLPAGQYLDYLRPTGPGRIYNAYRIDTSDSPYRTTMMNSVRTFAPQAAFQTHAADQSANYLQRTDPMAALASKPPMPGPYFNQGQPYEAQVRPTPNPITRRNLRARDYNLPGGTPAGQHIVR